MKTISFYSYKGGVGRSLALAYTAKYLADNNIKVCVLDIDLEAPGIGIKFEELSKKQEENQIKEPVDIYSKLGVVDYINSIEKGKIPSDINEEYFSTVYNGNIKIMGAGKGIYTNEYWGNLEKVNNLLSKEQLDVLDIFEILKRQIEKEINPDYLFIDSRAGVTKMSIVCTSVLPDKVVLCLANNTENFKGSAMMYHQIKNSTYYKINNTESDIICAITRFPKDDDISSAEKPLTKFDREEDSDTYIIRSERKIIDDFYNEVNHPKLFKNDIYAINSNSEIERDELLILQNTRFARRTILENNYIKIIDRLFVDDKLFEERKSLNKNEPKYRFIQFDLHKIIDSELKKYQGNMSFEDLQKDIENRLHKSPNSCELLYKSALCKRYYDNITAAIIDLFSATNDTIDDSEWKPKAHYLRGIIFLYDLHNYEKSKEDLEIVYEKTKNSLNPYICYDLALCYYCSEQNCSNNNCQNYDCEKYNCSKSNFKAMDYINRYMSDNEKDYRAFLLRANIMREFKDGRYSKNDIIFDYKKAVELSKKTSADPYNCRGNYYSYLGKDYYNEALEDYNEAIKIVGNKPKKYDEILYKNRGGLYVKLDNLQNAINDYNEAIKIASNYAEVYKMKGDIYVRLGQIPEALKEYKKAYEINPKFKIHHDRLKKSDTYYETLKTDIHYDFRYGLCYNDDDVVPNYKPEFNTYKYDTKEDIVTTEIIEFIKIMTVDNNTTRVMLSDQGKTLKSLAKIFELGEYDVTKNLTSILKEFNVFKNGFDFSIEIGNITKKEEEEKVLNEVLYKLFRCVSFMDKMYIFYENIPNKSRFTIVDERKPLPRYPNPTIPKYQFPAKYCKYKICDEKYEPEYEFARVEKDGKTYITDQGQTYHMLDAVFDLKELDVQKNLHAIMEICNVSQIEDEFLIEINTWDENSEKETEEEKKVKHRLLECVSFMSTMRLFYI